MGYRVERAMVASGRRTWVVVDTDTFVPHPELLEFTLALEAADKSPNTVKAYLPGVAMLLSWCQVEGVNWRSVGLLQLARFKRSVQDAPTRTGGTRAAGSVSMVLTAVCEFLRFCAAAEHIEAVVADRLVDAKWVRPGAGRRVGEGGQFRRVRVNALRVDVPQTAPAVLSNEQVAAMRAAAGCARDRFLLRVLRDGGPRIGEILGLRSEDVHLLPDSRSLGCPVRGAHFHVVHRVDNVNGARAKSLRGRSVPVVAGFVQDYRDYQFERDNRASTGVRSPHVFVTYEGPSAGQPMTYSNAFQIVARLGRRCGVRVTPHMFRHTAATGWVEAGAGPDVVQELLGHASPQSTAIYLHPTAVRMREAVERVAASAPRGLLSAVPAGGRA